MASRFRNDSELSRLNARAGSAVEVSADLFEAIEVALAMAAATEGLVDPTVGVAMNRLGYDRDFAQVRPGVEGDLPPAQAAPGWRSVSVDRNATCRHLPEDTALDLGATAKALAADRAAATIHRRLGCGVLVSLGGDAATAGPAPAGGFAIGIADTCTSPTASEAVSISSGGLASSGIGVRQWRLGAHRVHHIVDPGHRPARDALLAHASPPPPPRACRRTPHRRRRSCWVSAPSTGWRDSGFRPGWCGSTGRSSTRPGGRSPSPRRSRQRDV